MLEKPSRIDVSTVHHHHRRRRRRRRGATFVLGMLTLSWSHQIAGWLVQRILYSIAKPTPISGGGTPAYLDLLAGHWVVICGNREMKISFKACCMHPSSIHTTHTHTHTLLSAQLNFMPALLLLVDAPCGSEVIQQFFTKPSGYYYKYTHKMYFANSHNYVRSIGVG